MIVNRPMNLNEVPFIPANLTPNDIGLLIPEGFEEHMEWELVNTSLTLKFQNSDIENAEVIIDQSIYNPEKSGTRFPNFLFEMSSLRTNKRPNYFTTHADYLLNQNQLIYLILQHRLYSFSQYKKAYAYLLARDIRAVNNFIEYLVPKAHNAVQKCNNTWVLLSVWDKILSTASKPVMKEVNGSRLIGDILSNGAYKPNDTQLPMICEDLPIHPSSESALSKTGKITVHPYEHSQLYRSVGYKQEAEGFWSIFPPKQNIVARLKTHMISDALEVAFPATSVFFQDNIPNTTTRQYERKDNCLREAIVVFQTINTTTRRFLAGEIEASTAFVDTLIYKEQSKTEQFDEVYINAGETKACDGKFVLGTRLDDTLVHLHDTDEVTCLSRRPIGILGIEKLRLKVRQAAGNARIDSNTGLKGVTKCKPNLGLITFDDPQFGTLRPDLIVGMNATKAKVNTIALAKAALAVKLGTYKPNNAWGLIDSLNEAEINAAIASLPTFVYTDEFGDVQEAHIGLAYPRFTELASTYGRFKEQSFMFETGRLMYQNGNKEFFEHIWKDYVKEETVDIIQELTKIIHDTGNEFPEDDLPHMAPLSVSKTFEQSDFVFTKVQTVPSASKLLDEEWNKGFYLNLSGVGGPIIRIPSAKVFNRMVSELPDKTWSYPAILTKVSNMLSYCFVSKETGYNRVGYIFDRSNSGRYTEHLAYGNEVTKILYTGEESGQMFVQKLLKPEVMGFAKKQVSDPLIPSNTCVIFDEKLYQKLMDHTFQDSEMPELDYLLNGLRLFFMRHPALWLTQAKNLRVWNRDDYARHLAVEHGIMINDYLDASRNKDIIFIDVDSVVRDSHADVDKQTCPLF